MAVNVQPVSSTVSLQQSTLKMAESREKIEFQFKKKQIDSVKNDAACHFCKIVPRKEPIYQFSDQIACSLCAKENDLNWDRNKLLEKILLSLPTPCKFMKNDCKIVQDSKNIVYHEEVCEYRNITCVYENCQEICVAKKLPIHLTDQHKLLNWTKSTSTEITMVGSKYFLEINLDDKNLAKNNKNRHTFFWIVNDVKEHFFVQFEKNIQNQTLMIWVQLYGSKIEAKNYKYFAKLDDPSSTMTFFFKGQVKSVTDDKVNVFNDRIGFVIELNALTKCLQNQNNVLRVELGIESLKKQEEEKQRQKDLKNDYEDQIKALKEANSILIKQLKEVGIEKQHQINGLKNDYEDQIKELEDANLNLGFENRRQNDQIKELEVTIETSEIFGRI